MIVIFLDLIVFIIFLSTLIYCLVRSREYFETAPTNQDRTDFIWTQDGHRIAVHRYFTGAKTEGQPVILCHGLAGNRFIFDLKNSPSLAEFLKTRNRDVWVPELRGSGYSGRPGLLLTDNPLKWNFDDHLNYDVSAIIDHVIKETGSKSVHWVGHSMGGMLIEAYIARNQGSQLASAIAIASPADFSAMGDYPFKRMMGAKPALKVFPFNPMIPLTKCVFLFYKFFPKFPSAFFCLENIYPSVLKKIVAIGTELISSSGLWQDMARFLEQGKFEDSEGRPYLKGLESSATPLLAMCGTKDRVAPRDSALAVCAASSAYCVREAAVMGKESGCKSDYGHVDLLLGVRAHEEVFPMIEDWLKRWDS